MLTVAASGVPSVCRMKPAATKASDFVEYVSSDWVAVEVSAVAMALGGE